MPSSDPEESELISILTDALAERMSELEEQYPFTSGGIEVLAEKFVQPESFETSSLKYAEDNVLAATFRMYWFNRSHFCLLEDKDKRDDLAQFANEDDYDDPASEVKPQLFTDALAFRGKPELTNAILTEVWKSMCGKDAERAKDRQSIATKLNVITSVIGTKLQLTTAWCPLQ